MVATWSAAIDARTFTCKSELLEGGCFLPGQVYFYTPLAFMLKCDTAQNLFCFSFLSFTHLTAASFLSILSFFFFSSGQLGLISIELNIFFTPSSLLAQSFDCI